MCLGKELHLPGSSSAPCPAPPCGAPPSFGDPLVYKGRMARPWAERGGGPGAQYGGQGWLDAATSAGTHRSASSSPGLPFPAGAHLTPPGPCRPANPRPRADLPLVFPGLGREVPAGIPAGTWARAGDAQPRKASSCVQAGGSPSAERRVAIAGGRGAPGECLLRARVPPGPGMRPLGIPASDLPAVPAGPEQRGRLPAPWPWMESEEWGGGLRTP